MKTKVKINLYKEIPSILKDRKITVYNTLDNFNTNHVNQLKIMYYQNNISDLMLAGMKF